MDARIGGMDAGGERDFEFATQDCVLNLEFVNRYS